MPSPSPVSLPARERLPDLHALEAFVTVCEAGSVTLAAQRLGLSQSAVSQLVRSLETGWGLELLDREVRPARLTAAGRRLHALAQDLLAQARGLGEQLRSGQRQDRALIRMGCVDSFAATVGPELIRALSGSTRQILLWSGLTPMLAAQLHGREIDMAVCTDVGPDDARLNPRLLFSESWVAVFPRGPAWTAPQRPRDLAALAGELPLIRYSQRSVTGQQIERWLHHVGLRLPRRFEFDATDPLLSLVAAGLGWAISTPLCLWQSRQYLDAVTLLPLPASRLGQRDFFLLSRAGEWDGLDAAIARITRDVIRRDTAVAIRRVMPALPDDALHCPDEELS